MEAEAWGEDNARGKEREVESSKVSSLESCVKVWEGGCRGQKGTGL